MDPKQAHEAAAQLDPDWRPYIAGGDDEPDDGREHQASFQDLQREAADELWQWLLECRTCRMPHTYRPLPPDAGPLGAGWRDPVDGHPYRPRLHPSIVDGLRAEHARTREA